MTKQERGVPVQGRSGGQEWRRGYLMAIIVVQKQTIKKIVSLRADKSIFSLKIMDVRLLILNLELWNQAREID